MNDFCIICDEKMGGIFGQPGSRENSKICINCAQTNTKEAKVERNAPEAALAQKAENMPLTTGFQTAAGVVEQELDVITAECVFGMNIFRDLLAGVRDIAGGRSEASQNVLRDVRKEAPKELRLEAARKGADAVIGVHLDYN
jgi:uncharacterized protein YbjQ (UPF0145 family)